MTRIKICGLRELEHARAAVEAGAEMLGFILYPPVRRYVSPEAVKAILDELPRGRFEAVGVFVNETPELMNDVAELLGLDLVQLSGDEPPETTSLVSRPVVRTVHVDASTTNAEIAERARGARLVHLDAKKVGSYGGTGMRFDWSQARAAAEVGPILLAGGLSQENVGEAIATVAPWGVDVSSGVETDGVKDPAKIEQFVRAARAEVMLR